MDAFDKNKATESQVFIFIFLFLSYLNYKKMKKNYIRKKISLFTFFLAINCTLAQVGIATSDPKAVLEIRASSAVTPANNDGLLIPRIDVFPSINPTADQNGMLVYLTTTAGFNTNGFYYWNNATTSWNPLTFKDADWFQENTTNNATSINNNIYTQGNVGIGVTVPTQRLHVNGPIRIVDGTQADAKVLTSDANGNSSWQSIGIENVLGVLGAGVNIPSTTANFLQTGSSITLPPGRYSVNITMLMIMSVGNTPADSSFWLRTSFSDTAGANPTYSTDIVGSSLISGNFPGSSSYSIVYGTVVINNTSGANKTYYYIAGSTNVVNTTQTLSSFGGTSWGEDTIIAYRLN